MNTPIRSHEKEINHRTAGNAVLRARSRAVFWTAAPAFVRMVAAMVLVWTLCGSPAFSGTIHFPFSGSYFFVPSQTAVGGIPNAIPFSESFDSYSVDAGFAISTNGWVQTVDDASRTVEITDLPVIPASPSHFSGNCLSLNTEGHLLYNSTTGRVQNMWVDLYAWLVPCEELPREEMTAGSQLGLCLDSDSRLNVYCGLTNGFLASGVQFEPAPGRTVRLTLQIAYGDALTAPYFRISVNQTNVIWDAGYRLPDIPSATGGAWLPCATTNRTFHGLGFAGWGYVDNLSFSDTYRGRDSQPQAGIAQAVAISWPSDYGRLYQVETCEDLANGEWQPMGEAILGNGETNAVFDTVGPSACRFYRVTPL